ncbi:hypothetical protein SPRG_02533 [Saprolegnia parasitica CBS 223.65]|uniref:Uncharacterized protein n=1 Tax=Saprolegnia parasitica (strain CBS 223.65) TaxID=695850 RepID=A0A067CUB0_SAPPC|nr:hypothetical protein SPRG_02533 [Saprolegnia parasitica CBS 223.65]KDO32840.1 hypothetical protein SPRG_02533 [Saprolegnia parasitica CBS 223.65]|eukprot:XP_012196495.1 hypothetical protein SPRG_02533 [Saprolegnia parasitica CBS 223.65]
MAALEQPAPDVEAWMCMLSVCDLLDASAEDLAGSLHCIRDLSVTITEHSVRRNE